MPGFLNTNSLLIRLLGLTILPILVGSFNDYVIYAHLLDTSQIPDALIPLLAVFDVLQRLLLSGLSFWFLLGIAKEVKGTPGEELVRIFRLLVVGLLAIESMNRLTGTYGAMSTHGLPYKLAGVFGLKASLWVNLPVLSIYPSILLWGAKNGGANLVHAASRRDLSALWGRNVAAAIYGRGLK